MVDEDDARRTADALLSSRFAPGEADDEIVVWKIDEHTRAWIVHVATRRWIKTRDFRDQLVGSCPLVVEKATGELHEYGSGPDGYSKYSAWLDR